MSVALDHPEATIEEMQYIMGSLDHPDATIEETQYIMQQSFPVYGSTGQEYKISCVLRWSTSLAVKLLLTNMLFRLVRQ